MQMACFEHMGAGVALEFRRPVAIQQLRGKPATRRVSQLIRHATGNSMRILFDGFLPLGMLAETLCLAFFSRCHRAVDHKDRLE